MKFTGLEPQLFATILGALALVVGLLYIIKTRRRRVSVPFSPIWDRVLKNPESSRLWERLKRLLSFLIQVFFLALVLSAIADPRDENERKVGRNILLLVDTSASMSALDVSGGVDRLDIARQRAGDVLEGMGPLDVAMLVTIDGQLRPLTPFVKDVAILRQGLKDLKTTATPADIGQAMQFVRDAVVDKPDAEVYLFSDGVFAQDAQKALERLPATVKFKHIITGESGNNVAVTSFNVRRYLSNRLNYEIYVSVQNYFERAMDLELRLLSDGELVEKKPLKLEPGESKGMFFPNEGFVGKKLEARVAVATPDARDVFPGDDRAYAVLPSSRRVSVALVTEGNLFLEAPLVSNSNVERQVIAPSAWSPAVAEANDLVIFDRFVPPELPKEGNFMFVAPPEGDVGPWKVGDLLDKPTVNRKDKKHPMMRWVTFQDANIVKARKVTRARGDDVAAAAGASPMIVTLKEEGRNLALFAFDVRGSDLPLRVALPVLMLNAIDYFSIDGDSIVPTYRTGRAWSIPVNKQATSATIVEPDEVEHTVPVYKGRAIFYGVQAGFHTVKVGEESFLLASNLADPVESNIKPAEALELAGRTIEMDTATTPVKHQDYWIYLVLAALLLLLVEWLTYNRRWTV